MGEQLTEYDIFVSLGGPDRASVYPIVDAFGKGGLRVFIDESIPAGDGVTGAIEEALRSSKILVAYYSVGYPSRWACQFELTAALLAGEREGDPVRRIVVINPEAGEGHLYPGEVADAKFLRPPPAGDRKAMAALVAAVRSRVDAVSGTFGEIRFVDRPRWFADRPAGAPTFVGRYREQWALHTALRRSDYPLVHAATSGPAVALTGVAGSGKSTLAAAYAWQFGAAYPGGVFWASLTGATASDALERYGAELRRIVRMLDPDLDVRRADRWDLVAAVANRIFRVGEPALWVVDDVPSDLDRRLVEQLVLPAVPRLRTILISRHGRYDEIMPIVQLGRMSPDDARLLLRGYREPDPGGEDAAVLDAVVARLGGHAFSLTVAGRQLRDRHGTRSYADYARRLATDPTVLDPATDLIRDLIEGLDDTERLVLQVATACASAALPAKLVAGVAARVRPGDVGHFGDVLARLHELSLANRIDEGWQFHAIVRDATSRYLAPVVAPAEIARVAADQVLLLARDPDARPDPLMPHAAALADDVHLDAATGEALRHLLIGYYRDRGESWSVANQWDRVLESGSVVVADLLAAAEAYLDAAGYERAIEYAERATRLLPSDHEAMVVDRVLAQALDALGRFGEADAHWARVAGSADAPFASTAMELAYIRSRRLRGDMRTALNRAGTLVTALQAQTAGRGDDELMAAYIELATIQASTNAQQQARQTAEAVLGYYGDRNLPEHSRALAAQAVHAQAWLTLHLLELNPDPARWREAARSLQELGEQLRKTHGPLNAQTLTVEVEYGYALLCLGQPNRAGRHLTATLDRLHQRFDARHPLALRATLLMGRSYAQRRDYPRSRDLHQDAYTGLLTILGPRHPDTLHAQ